MGGNNQDSQAASKQAAQNASNSQSEFNQSQAITNNLYGPSGTLSSFTNPDSLNVSSPTGPSLLQYNNAVQNTANQYKDASGQLSRSMALRGFGADSPSGMEASGQEQLAADQADAQGANFTNYTNQAYQTALNNFWNANQLESGAANNMAANATQGGDSAAGTYANLYQTSAQFNPWNSVLSGAGMLGAAALGNGGAIAKVV